MERVSDGWLSDRIADYQKFLGLLDPEQPEEAAELAQYSAFHELQSRRAQRCETCGNGYESITGDIACPFIVDEMPRSGYCNFHYHKETDDADH